MWKDSQPPSAAATGVTHGSFLNGIRVPFAILVFAAAVGGPTGSLSGTTAAVLFVGGLIGLTLATGFLSLRPAVDRNNANPRETTNKTGL